MQVTRPPIAVSTCTSSNPSQARKGVFGPSPQLVAKDAEFAVRVICAAMIQALLAGHRIKIRDVGSFCLNHRPPRTAHNPKSGEPVQMPAKYVPHFKAGKELRARVHQKKSRQGLP